MRYLITGGAGFIGSSLADALLARGDQVICLDNFNPYYDPARKRRNVAAALDRPGYTLVEGDFRDQALLEQIFAEHRPEALAHLGGMANPRYSVDHPHLYTDVNVRGSLNLFELAGRHGLRSLVYASTSSVYGRAPTPWTEDLPTDRPLSPYAATKKAAELLAYTLHNQYGTPTRVVRFFTVYGPRGRPDMTPALFVDRMRRREPITLFNGGAGVYRDWTYIGDIVAGLLATLDSELPFEVFNLGNSNPVQLRDFMETLERVTGMEARIEERPLPETEPPVTYADITKAQRLLGFRPSTPLELGLERFWAWYRDEEIG
jgi:UDP-glucuronate 4-epimerase